MRRLRKPQHFRSYQTPSCSGDLCPAWGRSSHKIPFPNRKPVLPLWEGRPRRDLAFRKPRSSDATRTSHRGEDAPPTPVPDARVPVGGPSRRDSPSPQAPHSKATRTSHRGEDAPPTPVTDARGSCGMAAPHAGHKIPGAIRPLRKPRSSEATRSPIAARTPLLHQLQTPGVPVGGPSPARFALSASPVVPRQPERPIAARTPLPHQFQAPGFLWEGRTPCGA